MIDYARARAIIEAELSAEFAAVKDDPKADDTPESDTAIGTIEAAFGASVEVWRDVPVPVLAGWMELRGNLYERTAGSLDGTAKKLARVVSGQSKVDSLEMTNPDKRAKVQTMLDNLVAAGVWTQAEADAVLAELAKQTVPRWRAEAIGGPVGRGAILLLKSGRA